MSKRIGPGAKLPFFRYDTPYSAQNSFRQLLAQTAPLVLVFMSNFGHPVTRTFAGRYARTFDALTGGGFALVVRSRADKLSRAVGPDTLPYPLLCDAKGVLYDLLDIPARSGALATYSLEARLPPAPQRGPAASADTGSGGGRHGSVQPLRRKPDRCARRLRGRAEAAGGSGRGAARRE